MGKYFKVFYNLKTSWANKESSKMANSMLIFIMYCYVHYKFQTPAVYVLYFAFEIKLN